MTQKELKDLLNELAKKITDSLKIIPQKIEKATEYVPFIKIVQSKKTPNITQIEYDRILYKLGDWDKKKPVGILVTLAHEKNCTDRDRRPSEYKNNDDLYLTLSYEFEIGDTKRSSPQQQASSRRFLYHFIITKEKEFIRRNHELKENNNKGKTNPHINRWITKKCIKLEPDKNVILSKTTVDKCKKEIEEMMTLVNKGINKYHESGEEDKEILSSIIAELLDNGNEDYSTEDSLLPIAKEAYKKIRGNPYTGENSFSDLFCSLEDKDETDENGNKKDDNWEGAREELLKEILRQITRLNNGQHKNIMTKMTVQEAKPHNRILFGAPGTGKSFKLKQDVEVFYGKDKPLEEACTERVTFHPEYSYFDFVGSYKPVMVSKKDTSKQKDERETNEDIDKVQQGEIIYDFVPGPFARVLKKALNEKKLEKNERSNNFVLIIEEINRAKVAAVFGDIFQLLDRNEEGESEYGINPSKEFRNFLELSEGEKLKLPNNMYIWATMNSADQGVYPMDTAFKRRWSFEYTEIDDGDTQMEEEPYHKDWETLRKHVNELLQKEGINEDKQMGPFFLKKSELQNQTNFKKAVQNKVLMYLFEDAAKHKRKKIFIEPDKGMRYSAICKIFEKIYTESEKGEGSKAYTMDDIIKKLFHSTK